MSTGDPPATETASGNDALVGRLSSVALGHSPPDLNRLAKRGQYAGELGEKSVARGLHDAAAMRHDRRIDNLVADRPQACEGARVVAPHVPAVADDVGDDDGGDQ